MGILGHHALRPNQSTAIARPQADPTTKQPRQLLVALLLLLIALGVVLNKNRDFWFGWSEAAESDAAHSENVSTTKSTPAPVQLAQTPVAKIAASKDQTARKLSTPATATVHPNTVHPNNDQAASNSPVIAAKRTVLPPLDVEVVAGDTHSILHPGSSAAKVEIRSDANRSAAVVASMDSLPSNAAERASLRSTAVPEVRQTLEATYPLLGQHASVQGSVVLQAVVGTDGSIEDLRVLSGPAILSTAAQQAVRQWRFKPYLQNGQPVETKARITVNFSIRISDNPAKTS
ncbi:MAG: energy transducer TonB [Candidatus Sulfotelmatobacter sp.]